MLSAPILKAQNKSALPNIDQKIRVNEIYILGNKKTKENIILREMSLKKETYISLSEIKKSIEIDKRNILNTNLFNTVSIDILEESEEGSINVFVKVDERWYFFPAPLIDIADRNLMDWLINREGDVNRFNYGLRLTQYNLRGQNQTLKFIGKVGFERNLLIDYMIPFIDNNQKHGLRFIHFYSESENASYITKDHVPDFFDSDVINKKAYFASTSYTYRPSFYNFHEISLSYLRSEVSDTVVRLNPNYHFNQEKKQTYFGLSYNFISDHRNNKRFATAGTFLQASLENIGLGHRNQFNLSTVSLKFNKYTPLGNDFFLANGIMGLKTFPEEQPYFNYQGLGYNEMLARGFELELIEGSKFLLQKNTLRRKIFDYSKDIKNLIPISQFAQFRMAAYLKFFADFAWVDNYPNYEISSRLTNQLLYSFGVGLDLVSMYDIVLRLEYSYNSENECNFALNIKADL
ncbi:MAG: hypothetical protein CMB82_08315 [Flammeovirgaceae bacterium]|nr:hypothetical protein [Flammeovirgaceae bacterium]